MGAMTLARGTMGMTWRWRDCGGVARVCAAMSPAIAASAHAQDVPAIGTAALPRDLSPYGMFMSADVVVKGVIVGLLIASIVTWTVFAAKTIEILIARRRIRAALRALSEAA